jgi:hypothetical protein
MNRDQVCEVFYLINGTFTFQKQLIIPAGKTIDRFLSNLFVLLNDQDPGRGVRSGDMVVIEGFKRYTYDSSSRSWVPTRPCLQVIYQEAGISQTLQFDSEEELLTKLKEIMSYKNWADADIRVFVPGKKKN